jgi:hypothetical protein
MGATTSRKRLLRVWPWAVVPGLLPAGAASPAPEATHRFEVTASRHRFEPARIEVRHSGFNLTRNFY